MYVWGEYIQVFGTSGSRSVQEYIEHVESIHDIEESTHSGYGETSVKRS